MIREVDPTILKETETTRKGKGAQEKTLEEYAKIADSGYSGDPRFRALVERAKRRAQGEAQSRGQSLSQQMARRGLGGSGIEMASQLASNAAAMDRLADTEMDAASSAYEQRLNALAGGATLGRQMSQDDLNMQKSNLDIINDFNRRMSEREMRLAEEKTREQNLAQRENLKSEQDLAKYNVERQDEIARTRAEEDRMETSRQDRLGMWDFQRRAAERDRADRIAQEKANWSRSEREYQNRIKDRKYENELSQARGKAGLEDRRSAMERSNLRDRQAAIGAVGETMMRGAQLYGDWEDRKLRREKFNKRGY